MIPFVYVLPLIFQECSFAVFCAVPVADIIAIVIAKALRGKAISVPFDTRGRMYDYVESLSYYRNTCYTESAQNEYGRGMKMKALAGAVITSLNQADDWNNFLINSDDTIRKDSFFYPVIKGNIDYDYKKKFISGNIEI